MTKLTTLSCVACSGESPLATPAEIETLRLQVPEWNILMSEGVGKLERVFEFGDFIQALEFTNNVGNLAEQENHHPALLTEWGRVTVTWWTHKIGGLHHNDFVAAAKTDQLFA
ncbi:MAG: 4a-hydroxytetrahydrobiopterin dehydratase [Chloroflexota bacterium]|nr:4a-hydroxytetrahydrobiopterin dehydratase [Chloroflexota bacterium]